MASLFHKWAVALSIDAKSAVEAQEGSINELGPRHSRDSSSVLKKVSVSQLRLGMFIQEFCGSWIENPFWRNRFLIKNSADIQTIQASGILEVWIDTARGLDAVEHTVRPGPTISAQSTLPTPLQPKSSDHSDPGLTRAAELYRKSRPQMISLFNEARLGQAIDTASCNELIEEISQSVIDNPGALISVVRLKTSDEYTYMHSVAVCALMVALARRLGMGAEAVREAGLAGMLHDIGKAKIPLHILNKPSALDPEEFSIMRTHPERGGTILRNSGSVSNAVIDVCLHHHEKIDGSGYPNKMDGSNLSQLARMAAVCDVYDAITSERPYKAAWTPGDALRKMAQWQGHFDYRVFQTFVKTVGIYPTGSLVRLQSERLAVVCGQTENTLLKPKVTVFYSIRTNERLTPIALDLSDPQTQDSIVSNEDNQLWSFPDLGKLWGAPDLVQS